LSARGNRIFGDNEIRFLRELVRARVEFMIVGLSAAALQGAAVVTQDVDLWFRDTEDVGIKKALKKVGGKYLSSMGDNPPVFVGDVVEFFDIVLRMHGLGEFDEEKEGSIKVALGAFKVPVLPLARIIKSKQALGRPKDRLYLKVLADTQKSNRGRVRLVRGVRQRRDAQGGRDLDPSGRGRPGKRARNR